MSEDIDEIVNKRFKILEEGRASGNIGAYCKKSGISRATYYSWLTQYIQKGLKGLAIKKREIPRHPHSSTIKIISRVCHQAILHPDLGCFSIRKILSKEGISLSATTVQKIFNDNGLRTFSDRYWASEEKAIKDKNYRYLREEYAVDNWNMNPCMSECLVEAKRPGDILIQSIRDISSGSYSSDEAAMYIVVDSYGGYTLTTLYRKASIENASDMLKNIVFPFYAKYQIPISNITLTLQKNQSIEIEDNAYTNVLSKKNISGNIMLLESYQENGFVERFLQSLEIQFRKDYDEESNIWFERVRNSMAENTKCYNATPQRGYRNFGHSPQEIMDHYKKGTLLL